MLPRRLLRLSNAELVASLRTLGPLAEADLPASWQDTIAPLAPNPSLSVSRDFLDQVGGLATRLADRLTVPDSCDEGDFGLEAACTRSTLAAQAHLAFRGQEEQADVDALVSLALEVGARSGATEARRLTTRAIALSPRMLYLSEGLAGPVEPSTPRPLSPAELANFLSFRLIDGPAPAALLTALSAEPQPSRARLAALIDQHLGAGAVAQASREFLAGYVNLSAIGRSNKDLSRNPYATPAFMASLQQEAWASLGTLASDPSTGFAELLTGPVRSAAHLDAQSRAFSLTGRPGVFALPGVIAATSGGFETNVPRRGRFLLRRLFCETLSSPPAGAVNQAPPLPPNASQRERFTRVQERESCNGCHARTDHLAFPFEVLDEVGKARVEDEFGNVLRTDDVHQLTTGDTLTFTDAADLLRQVSQLPWGQACFSSQAFTFFARQPELNPFEACAGDVVLGAARLADGGVPLREVVLGALTETALAPRAD